MFLSSDSNGDEPITLSFFVRASIRGVVTAAAAYFGLSILTNASQFGRLLSGEVPV